MKKPCESMICKVLKGVEKRLSGERGTIHKLKNTNAYMPSVMIIKLLTPN